MPVSLVTGATAGIGAAFARALARRGHDLVLVARDEARLATSAAELSAHYGVEVEVLPADLAVPTQLAAVAARLEDPGRPVEWLVNNAGFSVGATLASGNLERHRRAMDVMCFAVLVLGGAAARAMRARGRGRIVNVSSLAAWVTQGHYSAIKAWVRSYSEGLANELHHTGVTVTALSPGWVRTEFHERAGIRTSGIPDWAWVDADLVAERAVRDAEAGRMTSIPTLRWKAARAFLALAPAGVIRRISRSVQRSGAT